MSESKMNSLPKRILELIEVYNKPIIQDNKKYYDSLDESRRNSLNVLSFSQHIEKYSDIIKTEECAKKKDLDKLEKLIQCELPEELRNFYLKVGGLSNLGIKIHSADFFIDRLGDPEKYEKYDQVKSIGLIDMIVNSWGNDRHELQPERNAKSEEYISHKEIDFINSNFKCIGWLTGEGEEAHHYIYFDRDGKFGTVYYHQDLYRDLWQTYLKPMQTRSLATESFFKIIVSGLELMLLMYEDDNDEVDFMRWKN